jgi:hypothetical protein
MDTLTFKLVLLLPESIQVNFFCHYPTPQLLFQFDEEINGAGRSEQKLIHEMSIEAQGRDE